MAQPPLHNYDSKVIYDFITDPDLVPKMIGYRQERGFTVDVVNLQPDTEANYVTDLPSSGFPTKTSLAIAPQTKTWLIISHA